MTYRPFLVKRLCLIFLVAAAGRLLYVLPDQIETGRAWDSPDGRYRLETWSRSGVSFWRSRPHYYEFAVVDLGTGRVHARMESEVPPGELQTDYGAQWVKWAEDGLSVSFAVGERRRAEVPLP